MAKMAFPVYLLVLPLLAILPFVCLRRAVRRWRSRAATASSSSPLSALARRALHLGCAPVPLPRRLPAAAAAAASSPAAAARRFLASQSPASASKDSADENLRRVIESEIECVVQSEESLADKVRFFFILFACLLTVVVRFCTCMISSSLS